MGRIGVSGQISSGEVSVRIAVNNYGQFGGVAETIPADFTYVAGSSNVDVEVDGRTLEFALYGEVAVTYRVTASDTAGSYVFSGDLIDDQGNRRSIGGVTSFTVTPRPGQGSGSSQTRLQRRPRSSNRRSQSMPWRMMLTVRTGLPQGSRRLGSGRPRIQYGAGFGRRAQVAWSNPAVMGVFHPGAIGQGQQCFHRQHQPVAGDARRVGAPGLVPLPAQAFDGLEAQFDPEAQGVPTGPGVLRRQVSEDDPGFFLLDVPDRQQGAAAFCVWGC